MAHAWNEHVTFVNQGHGINFYAQYSGIYKIGIWGPNKEWHKDLKLAAFQSLTDYSCTIFTRN